MRFGEIIKKAWHITWHYRWLWVLGAFAGVTGSSGGGGGGGGGGGNTSNLGRSFGSGGGTGGSAADFPDMGALMQTAQTWLPFVLIVTFLLVVMAIAFAIVGIGARGGLVWAVDELEEGRTPRLGDAWNAGFSRFWSIFGLGLLLQGPLIIAGLLLAAMVLVPLLGPLMRGQDPDPALILGPMCGVLVIGVPLLLIAGLVLSIMYITALRFIMITGMGTVHAAGESWRALRKRLGDHALMYIISLALSFVAGLALAIPIVILGLSTIIPAVIAASGRDWGLFAGMTGLFVVLVFVVSLAFSAVWGTFTSAMWTIFFRRLTGREALAAIPAGYPPPTPQGYQQPTPAPVPPQVPDAGYPAAPQAPVTASAPGYPPPAPEPDAAPGHAPPAPEPGPAPAAPPMYAPPPAQPASDAPDTPDA